MSQNRESSFPQSYRSQALNTENCSGERLAILLWMVPPRMRGSWRSKSQILRLGFRVGFHGIGEQVCGSASWAHFNRVTLEPGHSWQRGVNTRSSWTTDTLLLRVPEFEFWLCPNPSVPWGGESLCSECSWRSKFSPLHMFQLHGLRFWSIISEKQLRFSVNRIGPF